MYFNEINQREVKKKIYLFPAKVDNHPHTQQKKKKNKKKFIMIRKHVETQKVRLYAEEVTDKLTIMITKTTTL